MKNSIRVAILDTGIDTKHEYLKDSIYEGIGFIWSDDYITITDDYEDDNGHGTACASIIKREFENVEFIVIKILDKYGQTNIQILEEALKMLINKEIDIVNLSLSVMKSEMVKDLYKICDDLRKSGKIIVCSLANGFNESYPATFSNVIGVRGMILEEDSYFWFNKNKKIQCIIDSKPYLNCHINNSYRLFGKCNSQAAAKFTGKIANLLYENPNICEEELYLRLELLAQKTDWMEADLVNSRKCPNYKEGLYEIDNPLLIEIANIVREVLPIDKDDNSLYSCSLFNKCVGLRYNQCFDLIKNLENKFNINFKYMDISRDDLLSIYTLTELVEKNILKEGIN